MAPAAHPPKDILVFERSDTGFALIGGNGRGAGWAGIVDVPDAEDSLLRRAWSTGTPVRAGGRKATHVVGPYYARYAAAVPVGDRHVVVFGSDRSLRLTDTELTRLAASTVDRTRGVPVDKLLADELELVHTLRALMAYRPEKVRDTMRHIAAVAAGALSCEIAVIRVDYDGHQAVETIGLSLGGADSVDAPAGLAAWAFGDQPMVEQVADAELFPGTEIVSRITLPVGSRPVIGVLSLAHASVRPRGFTSLCQRIGRAVAEAAELLITQAAAREQLASERDRLVAASLTDALTGLANRRAWEEEVAQLSGSAGAGAGYVVTCDLDQLKMSNDRHGHAAGDELLRATASVLKASVRSTDLVARIGGDEFGVLLRDADSRVAALVRDRIRRAERRLRERADGDGPTLSLSIGIAPIHDGDVEAARQTADRRMYSNKRSRQRAASRLRRRGRHAPRAAQTRASAVPRRRSARPATT